MYVPPQTLWPTTTAPQGTLLPTVYRPGDSAYRILYTRGDDLLTAPQYRATFEQTLERAIRGTTNVNDDSLAKAFSVSSTAYACASYSANATAGIELIVRNPTGDPLTHTPLDHFLTQSARLLHRISSSLDIWGRVYLRKRYNAGGYPTGLEWINPLDIEERTERGRVIEYQYTPPERDHEMIPVSQIIYFEAFDTRSDGNGLSKFEVAWRAIGIEQGLATYAAAFFVNSARPDGMLTFDEDLDNTELDQVQKEWAKFKGASSAHRTVMLPKGAHWTPIQATPTTANTELKAGQREDICAIFGVDPMLVGLKGAADPLSANSTFSAASVNHLRNVVLPRLRMEILPALNEQWAYRDFSPRNTLTLDFDENSIPALSEANLARSETVINLTVAGLIDHNEGRKVLGYAERDDYFLRNPEEARQVFTSGGLTLGMFWQYTGVKPPSGSYTDPNLAVVLVEGKLYPLNRIGEIAHKNADGVGQLAFPSLPFGGAATPPEPPQLPPPPTAPMLPAPQAPTIERSADDTGSACYLSLSLANHPQVLAAQNAVRAVVGNLTEDAWQAPDTFHVTLIFAEQASDDNLAGIARAIQSRPIRVTSNALDVFENGDERALHLRVDLTNDLKALQSGLYDQFSERDLPMSDYSKPADYHPHITLCYLPKGVDIPKLDISVDTVASRVDFGRDDYENYLSVPLLPATPAHAVPETALSVARSIPSLELAVSFASHQFVRYARRALSDTLTTQGVTADWVGEDAWRLTLVRADGFTPADAASLIRRATYDDGRKIDATAGGYLVRDGGIYLRVTDTDGLNALRTVAALDVGIEGRESGYVGGILLCRVAGDVDLAGAAEDSYPLVCSNVTLYYNDEQRHKWYVRSLLVAQSVELKNWALVTMRNLTRGIAFNVDALRDTDTALFVRDALRADIEPTEVFDIAGGILRGDIKWRAYPETREGFMGAIVELFTAAQSSEIARRQFAASLRVHLRRYGLQAFRDGFNEVGQDPESFAPEELALFREWQGEQSSFVTKLGAEIFGQGITANEVENRVRMWADISLNDARLRGIEAGNANQRMIWVLGVGEIDHCDDCPRLANQVHTVKGWREKGFRPGNGKTQCKQGCQCGLVPTDEDERGDY